ncbi:MAG: diguanylate cyclase [Candidatus Riflebacteria bacterium]|nr:diguanylate cyclase [Candidatus Riflebacteria bacterium]
MEIFRNTSITKRIVITTFVLLFLPISVFLAAKLFNLETNTKVLIFLSNVFLLVGVVSAWLIGGSITGPIDRLRKKLALFIGKRQVQNYAESGEDELAELAFDLQKVFELWNSEIGKIVKKQKERTEENVKSVAAQNQFEAQLLLTRSCLQVAQKLNTSFDFQTNMKTILDEAVKTMNVQWASILLINRDTLEMTVACVRGIEQSLLDELAEDHYPSIKLKPNEGLSGLVIKEGVPLIANKGFRDPRFKSFSEFRAKDERVASILCAPIKGSEGTILGVINFINRINPPFFRNEDIPYASDLCTLASLVIERNRFYDSLFTDEATGLLGFRIWRSFFQEEASRAVRYSQTLSIVILEIEKYKELLEKTSQDFLIQISNETGRAIKKCLRDLDLASRVQGRFYVLLPNTDAAGAVFLVGRIKEAVEKFDFSFKDKTFKILINAGIASFPDAGPDPKNLSDLALSALEQAKSSGKGRARVFSRDNNEKAAKKTPNEENNE